MHMSMHMCMHKHKHVHFRRLPVHRPGLLRPRRRAHAVFVDVELRLIATICGIHCRLLPEKVVGCLVVRRRCPHAHALD